MGEPVTIGIVANPASGRDIRRLVARASVFPTAEKANMVQRMLTAFGSLGVDEAMLSTDLGGISAALLRALRTRRPDKDAPWPTVRFCDDNELTDGPADTTNAIHRMIDAGARVVVCLGGDGTARVAAAACGQVPLLALSTGTNNAFGQMREATVAGMAAALLATDAVEEEDIGTSRASMLRVELGRRTEIALVDVCASTARHVGSRALWDPATLTELFCTFAEPDGIGLSSVPGLLCPSPRERPDGVALRFATPEQAGHTVQAPIAPGLVADVGVRDWRRLPVGERVPISPDARVIAVDGERELEPHPDQVATVTLHADGPRCVDVAAVLAESARRGLLSHQVSGWPNTQPGREVPAQ